MIWWFLLAAIAALITVVIIRTVMFKPIEQKYPEREVVSFDGDKAVDVVNLKVPITEYGAYDAVWGVYPAYHMNKSHWLSVSLDCSVPDETVSWLLGISYGLTKKEEK